MINIHKLKTNARLVTEYLPYVQSVALGIWVKAGAVNETGLNAGISHYVEHMMFKGTSKRSAKQIASDIDKIGGQINAFTGKEATCYYVKTITENFEQAADVLIDMLTDSLLDPKEMDKERQVICEEIKMTLDTPDDLAHETVTEMVFAGRNIGNSIIGTPETLATIDQKVMRDYINSEYVTEDIVISISGNFDEQKVLKYFDNKFESLGRSKTEPEYKNAIYKPSYKSIVKDIEQSHMCICTDGIKMEDDRYFALAILNNIMGGSMSSRLFQNLRDEKGLAYSVYSMAPSYSKDGYFNIYAGVSHDKITETVEGIRFELEELAKNGITEEELASSREQLKASYIFGQENITGRMFKNGKNLLLLGKLYTADEIIDEFNKVTMNDIKEAEKLICDFDNYSAVIVSNKELDVDAIMKGK